MSRFISEFIAGVKSYQEAYDFTNQHHLWRFYWIPALINLLIFMGVTWLGWHYGSDLIAYLKSFVPFERMPDWAAQIVGFFITLLLRILTLILLMKLYRFIVMIFLSPVLGIIAEKVQLILLQIPEPEFDTALLIRNIIRGLRLTISNMCLELGITIPLMILGLFVPFLSPITTLLILTTESYFIGFGAIDLRNEFVKLSGAESRKIIWKRKGISIGNGLTFSLLLLIPVFGILFAPIFSVVAGNLAIHQIEAQNPTVPMRLEAQKSS